MIRRAAARALGAPLRVADVAAPADAIVVLGAPLTDGGVLSRMLAERVATGLALWHAGLAPRVCVTGGPSRGARTEAEVMAEAMLDGGVPAHALRVEPTARTTAENAARVAALLAPEGVRSTLVVTQRFHARRARWLFRRAGLIACAVPVHEGLHDQDPARALPWIVREYAAWARALVQPARGMRGSRR